MTPRERIIKTIRHEPTDIVPYQIPIEGSVADAVTAHYGNDEWRRRIVDHYVWTAPKMFAGIAPFPQEDGTLKDIFGGRWEAGNIVHQLEWPLKEPSLEGLVWPETDNDEDYEMVHSIPKDHPDKFSIAIVLMTLFERGWALRGMANFLADLVAEPAFCEELLDKVTEWNLRIVDKMCDSTVDAIGFTDDLGCQKGLLMGPDLWRQWFKPRIAQIFDLVHERGKFTYLHSCGDNTEIYEDLIEIGLDVFNPLQPECQDIFEIKRLYGDRLCLNGGISSQVTLPYGTAEEVRAETERCLKELGAGGGYIIEPNKPIMHGTPAENAIACIETILNQSVREV